MRKNIAIIVALAVGLAVLLIYRPWESETVKGPRFFDRLPDADIIGKTNVLELSRALSSSTYHYKVPFREFLKHEFILGQGKRLGIDIQKPAFFFANETDWMINDIGAMFMVSDSSKVREGLDQIDQLVHLKDTIVHNYHVKKQEGTNVYISYGADWLLLYHGNNFKTTFGKILFAKRNEIPPNWRDFLNTSNTSDLAVIAKLSSKNLEDHGIQSAYLTMQNDSTSITVNAEINQFDPLSFQIKHEGFHYPSQEFTRSLANVNLDIEALKHNPKDPFVIAMKKIGSKVSFPVDDLLNTWTGDLSFRMGGIQTIREKYIESELDENFNVTEVVKYRRKKVPGYSLYLSTNERNKQFVEKLMDKGILTKDDRSYRLLFSPPLQMNVTDSSLVFHTGKFIPAMNQGSVNEVTFTYNKTPYTIVLDSTSEYTMFCRFQIPLDQLVKDNLSQVEN
jgi:hypothetical protein